MNVTRRKQCEHRSMFSFVKRNGLWSVLLFASALLLMLPALSYAQQITGEILGTVTDPQGALIPNAKVTIENIGTGQQRTMAAKDGNYAFSLLQIGQYTVHVDAKGFKSISIPAFSLAAGELHRVNVKMEIGSQAQTVHVSASSIPTLDTDTSSIGQTISRENIKNLPMNGLNFITLAQVLVAGSTTPLPGTVAGGGRPDYRSQDAALSVNGQFVQANDFLIDGMDNNERVIGVLGVRPSVEAMSEFRVETNLYTADVGRTAGAVVNIITRAGTNAYHGAVYEYTRSDAMDASNYFALTKPSLTQNQYGAALGGPIVRNRSFFFADYQGLRKTAGTTSTLQVPTLYEQQHPGDLSDIGGPVIPTSAINPIAKNYFALYPAPNRPSPQGVGYYASSPDGTFDQQTGDVRLDEHFNSNNYAFLRYTINDTNSLIPSPLPAVNGVYPGGNLGEYEGPATDAQQNIQLNYVHIFTPHLISEFRAGYTRIHNASLPLNYGSYAAKKFGIINANLSEATSGLTPFIVGGYASLGDSTFLPLLDIDNTYQVNGDVIYNRGAQNIRIGAALVRRLFSNSESPAPTGAYIFVGTNVQTLEELFLGMPVLVLRYNQVYPQQYRVWEPSVYIQDDWHANSRLTLNLGVRYDVFTPYVERHNHIANFNPSTGKLMLAGVNGVSRSVGVKTDYGNIAPRIGFSYSATPTTVVRGGFGITYYPGYGINLYDPPFSFSYSSTIFGQPLSAPLPIPVVQNADNPSGTLGGNLQLDGKMPMIFQTSLGVEQAFGNNVLQVRYIGDFGRHGQQGVPNIDTPAPSTTPYASGQQLQEARPYYNTVPDVTQIYMYQYEGVSSYNALQVIATRRMTKGLAVNLNYTWAHALDDTTYTGDGTYGLVPSKIREYDYGNADTDIRHRIAGGITYDLPFGESAHGLRRTVTEGWQISTLGWWQTGYPFEVADSAAAINTGATADRPNQTGDPFTNVPSGLFFNPAVFQTQALGTVGTERRNAMHGPHQRDLDASASKTFSMTKRANLQFRLDVFNLTNTPNFGTPLANISDPGSVGRILSANDGRQMQGSLKLTF